MDIPVQKAGDTQGIKCEVKTMPQEHSELINYNQKIDTKDCAKQRYEYMDVLRSIAILMVISLHTIEKYSYYGILIENKNATILSWLFQNTIYILGRIDVPIFLMLSGALLLSKPIESIKNFYIKKVVPLCVTTIIWFVFYNMGIGLVGGRLSISLDNMQDLLLQIFTLRTTSANHLWYMALIIGLYLAFPFLSKLLSILSLNQALIFLTFSLLPCTINTISTILKEYDLLAANKNIITSIYSDFFGGYYLAYCIIGYLFVRYDFLKFITNVHIYIIFVFVFIIITVFQYHLFITKVHNIGNLWWYDDILIVILSTLFFLFIKRKCYTVSKWKNKIFYNLSLCSFGIYLCHIKILYPILDFLKLYNLRVSIVYIIALGFTVISSFIIVKLISLVPVINRFVVGYHSGRKPISYNAKVRK